MAAAKNPESTPDTGSDSDNAKAARPAPTRPAAVERPYSEAMTKEQREALKEDGLL